MEGDDTPLPVRYLSSPTTPATAAAMHQAIRLKGSQGRERERDQEDGGIDRENYAGQLLEVV